MKKPIINHIRRNTLIEKFFYVVESELAKLGATLPREVDWDALRSAGTAGLVDAATRCESDKEGTFFGYARIRIRGAMVDCLRRTDPTPRSARKIAKAIGRATSAAEARLGRAVTEAEVSAELGISERTLAKWHLRAYKIRLTSLDKPVYDAVDSEDSNMHDFLVDPTARVGRAMEVRENTDIAARLISELPPQQQRVIYALNEGLNLREVGVVMELTESRISQIQQKAVQTLQRQFLAAA